ncbi:MAG TPA: 2-oxo-4-hydroxy-4-carboxy-5-ureidoimidazoline decarboxylase [Xanthomonadaceae bacterium]|nr:2-oxo-4-hydroxy-4-carboxy-5-ureidoimidazoline decarboxylase [Xanthomonadaceae bacterium]
MTLDQLNSMTQGDFTAALAHIFEHSPWVPQRCWAKRPFASMQALHRAMCDTVAAAEADRQLALIRAHPQLSGKAAVAADLTAASRAEQHGAGLDRCTPEEFARLTELNDAYQDRFGFPFILAVRGHTRQSILDALAARLGNRPETEFAEALHQIERIAWLRLTDMMVP